MAMCLGCSFAQHPVYLFGLALCVPIIHEFHFFCIHRLIHTPFLYKWVHSVHHNSVNPSPWSSLSMHPVEHLLYFADSVLPPDHPVEPDHRALPAALHRLRRDSRSCRLRQGRGGRRTAVDSHAYAHYLHHKYFEVNYGDALIPLDRWFGTWHDGSSEGEARMQERYRKRKEKIAAQQARKAATNEKVTSQ